MVLSVIGGGIFLAWGISRTQAINNDALVFLHAMKEASNTENFSPLYEFYSPAMRNEVTFEEFDEAFNNPESLSYVDALDLNAFVFYNWQFTNDEATLIGDDGIITIEISLLKNAAGQWQPTFIWIY